MTKKKARVVQPYTINAAVSALMNFDEPLKKTVLKRFFEESNHRIISDRIHKAITTYDFYRKTNQDRKGAQKQRHDRQELIECLKELHTRLSPLRIPLPLLNVVKSIYIPYKSGKPTLDEEIRDLNLRVWHLKTLFDATPIRARNRTNPGKPERKQLVTELRVIFDDYTNYNDEQHRTRDKKQFVEAVFHVFHPLDHPPK